MHCYQFVKVHDKITQVVYAWYKDVLSCSTSLSFQLYCTSSVVLLAWELAVTEHLIWKYITIVEAKINISIEQQELVQSTLTIGKKWYTVFTDTPTHTDLVHSLKSAPSLLCILSSLSFVPRPHPRGEEKVSGYNTTSRPTLEGRSQHTIVGDQNRKRMNRAGSLLHFSGYQGASIIHTEH